MTASTAKKIGDSQVPQEKLGSIRAIQWTNFFLADVQAGVGPFVTAYLAGLGWQAGSIGKALTFGGIVTVLLQTPAGWMVDRAQRRCLRSVPAAPGSPEASVVRHRWRS